MRIKFLSNLIVTPLKEADIGRRCWRIEQPLEVMIVGIDHLALTQQRVTVPAGFVSDFASVPRLPLAYLLFGDHAHQAGVLHDYIYRQRLFPRAICDRIFLAAMKGESVAWWRRWPMYIAVRLFGWAAY